ncbi:MAG: phosphoribosyltransferase [Syntrophothermus sp.]
MVDLSFIEISEKIQNLSLPDNFDLVVGIATGGIVPASILAYKLKLDMKIIRINYRDEQNNPRYEQPVLLTAFPEEIKNKRILLVDDVSVSGKTLNTAKALLKDNDITTFALKGKADYVLFTDIKTCVNWPWK